MALVKLIHDFVDERKYGPVQKVLRFPIHGDANYCFGGAEPTLRYHYHIAGLVDVDYTDGRSRLLFLANREAFEMWRERKRGAEPKSMLDDDEDFEMPYVRDDGALGRYGNSDLAWKLHRLAQAYLNGRFTLARETPLNGELYMLPVPPEKLKPIVETVQGLENVAFQTQAQGYYPGRPYEMRWAEGEDDAQRAQLYLRELLFWQLNCDDYSDHVNFTITQRGKETQQRVRQAFIADRHWSRANQGGPTGRYRVVEIGKERTVIRGHEKKK